MLNLLSIDLILVPQGAEYQAVKRGLSYCGTNQPKLFAIPMGQKPLIRYLSRMDDLPANRILLMGLCGSLKPDYHIGDIVLYQNCVYQENTRVCHSDLVREMRESTYGKVPIVKGLTSDRLIWSAAEKRQLGKISAADVVDMEGFATLDFFQQLNQHKLESNLAETKLAILRVISDDCHRDIPDLSSAINADGSLQPWSLGWGLVSQPLAGMRFIRGSLLGLKVLQQVTTSLFTPLNERSHKFF